MSSSSSWSSFNFSDYTLFSRNPAALRYYNCLELPDFSSLDAVRQAYKTLALRYHPDKNLHNVEEATNKFTEVRTAYEVLSKEDGKKKFDTALRQYKVLTGHSVSGKDASGLGGGGTTGSGLFAFQTASTASRARYYAHRQGTSSPKGGGAYASPTSNSKKTRGSGGVKSPTSAARKREESMGTDKKKKTSGKDDNETNATTTPENDGGDGTTPTSRPTSPLRSARGGGTAQRRASPFGRQHSSNNPAGRPVGSYTDSPNTPRTSSVNASFNGGSSGLKHDYTAYTGIPGKRAQQKQSSKGSQQAGGRRSSSVRASYGFDSKADGESFNGTATYTPESSTNPYQRSHTSASRSGTIPTNTTTNTTATTTSGGGEKKESSYTPEQQELFRRRERERQLEYKRQKEKERREQRERELDALKRDQEKREEQLSKKWKEHLENYAGGRRRNTGPHDGTEDAGEATAKEDTNTATEKPAATTTPSFMMPPPDTVKATFSPRASALRGTTAKVASQPAGTTTSSSGKDDGSGATAATSGAAGGPSVTVIPRAREWSTPQSGTPAMFAGLQEENPSATQKSSVSKRAATGIVADEREALQERIRREKERQEDFRRAERERYLDKLAAQRREAEEKKLREQAQDEVNAIQREMTLMMRNESSERKQLLEQEEFMARRALMSDFVVVQARYAFQQSVKRLVRHESETRESLIDSESVIFSVLIVVFFEDEQRRQMIGRYERRWRRMVDEWEAEFLRIAAREEQRGALCEEEHQKRQLILTTLEPVARQLILTESYEDVNRMHISGSESSKRRRMVERYHDEAEGSILRTALTTRRREIEREEHNVRSRAYLCFAEEMSRFQLVAGEVHAAMELTRRRASERHATMEKMIAAAVSAATRRSEVELDACRLEIRQLKQQLRASIVANSVTSPNNSVPSSPAPSHQHTNNNSNNSGVDHQKQQVATRLFSPPASPTRSRDDESERPTSTPPAAGGNSSSQKQQQLSISPLDALAVGTAAKPLLPQLSRPPQERHRQSSITDGSSTTGGEQEHESARRKRGSTAANSSTNNNSTSSNNISSSSPADVFETLKLGLSHSQSRNGVTSPRAARNSMAANKNNSNTNSNNASMVSEATDAPPSPPHHHRPLLQNSPLRYSSVPPPGRSFLSSAFFNSGANSNPPNTTNSTQPNALVPNTTSSMGSENENTTNNNSGTAAGESQAQATLAAASVSLTPSNNNNNNNNHALLHAVTRRSYSPPPLTSSPIARRIALSSTYTPGFPYKHSSSPLTTPRTTATNNNNISSNNPVASSSASGSSSTSASNAIMRGGAATEASSSSPSGASGVGVMEPHPLVPLAGNKAVTTPRGKLY